MTSPNAYLRPRTLASAMLGVLLVACSAAPREAMPPPISAAEYERHIATLASDEFEGRKPGTAGERKTVDYLVAEFKKLGLAPGNGDSWVQQVPIVEITAASSRSEESLAAAKAIGGNDLRTFSDWREVVALDDLDAIEALEVETGRLRDGLDLVALADEHRLRDALAREHRRSL